LINRKTQYDQQFLILTIRRKSSTEFGTPNQWWDIRREKPKSFSTNTRCQPCKGKEHLRFFVNIIYEMDEEFPKFRDKVVES
jgi:hypothetical protein